MTHQLDQVTYDSHTGQAPPPAPPRRQNNTLRRVLIGLIALAVAIPLGLVIWNNGVRRFFVPTKFAVVEPDRLYRSGQISHQLIRPTLLKHHIGLIIDLSAENTPDAQAERDAAAALGVERMTLFLGGSGIGDPDVYPKAIAAIIDANRKGRPVLVHCQSGSQRTGGVIAAYRILVEGKSEAEAFSEAQKYGYNPSDNPRLFPFVDQHLPEWRSQLEQQHVLSGK